MSDSSDKHKGFAQTGLVDASRAKQEKNSSTLLNKNTSNRFTLIDRACETNLDSISRKLNDDKLAKGEQYFSNELNNNSIVQTLVEGSGSGGGLFKMDSSSSKKHNNFTNNESSNNKPTNATAPIAKISTSADLPPGHAKETNHRTPTYTSIFSPSQTSSYQQQQQQQQQLSPQQLKTGSRGQLKKQQAELDIELPVAAIDRLSQGGKLLNFDDGRYNRNHSEEDDEDDDIDERLPFSSSMSKQGSGRGKKSSPEPQQQQQRHHNHSLPMKHSSSTPLHHQQDNRCEFNFPHNNKHNNHPHHTKISFNDSRPPSFSTCQYNHHHHHNDDNGSFNGKLDGWREQCSHPGCGCNAAVSSCRNSTKSLTKHGLPYKDDATILENTKYSKTRSFQMVLKSIILILLTLLLLMLFIGIILASHYLPQMLDRVLSATRSFNVTIAG